MISYIKGSLEYIFDGFIVLETGGIGYEIQVPSSAMEKLPPIGSPLTVHTILDAKETGVSLFGFLSPEEKEIFIKLITVNGVGPKSALGILSLLSPGDIITAVISGDEKSLSKAPGIGKKTAQRIIIDLKDKFKSVSPFEIYEEKSLGSNHSGTPKNEAISALGALGYSNAESLKAVSSVYKEGMSTEDILKEALKKLSLF